MKGELLQTTAIEWWGWQSINILFYILFLPSHKCTPMQGQQGRQKGAVHKWIRSCSSHQIASLSVWGDRGKKSFPQSLYFSVLLCTLPRLQTHTILITESDDNVQDENSLFPSFLLKLRRSLPVCLFSFIKYQWGISFFDVRNSRRDGNQKGRSGNGEK